MSRLKRQANWRWQLVSELSIAGKRVPRSLRSDAVVTKALKFWNALQRCSDPAESITGMLVLQRDFPEVSEAYEIYSSLSLERYFIEALVMANAPSEDIAIETGYPPGVIETYEKLFFDVRALLPRRLYVMGTLLGPLFSTGTSSTDYDYLWKAIGYFCGVSALNAIWKIGKLSPTDAEQVTELLRSRLLTQATGAAFARRPNQYNSGEILESFTQYASYELSKSKADPVDGSPNADNYLGQILPDVIDYMKLVLKPHDSEQGTVERCLSGEGGDINESEFERPFKCE